MFVCYFVKQKSAFRRLNCRTHIRVATYFIAQAMRSYVRDNKVVWEGITVYPRLFGVNISSMLPTSNHKQD